MFRLLLAIILAVSFLTVQAFAPVTRSRRTLALHAQGFGEKRTPQEKSEAQVKREQQSNKYDEIAATGGQEYAIFVRQFGSDDQSWFPSGSIAVPRGAQVSDAIFANVENLRSAIVRTYPKLKGFEEEFEFGYNLKIYPDDPVEVAKKTAPRASGLSVGNWISNLLSPIDTSNVPPPPIKGLVYLSATNYGALFYVFVGEALSV